VPRQVGNWQLGSQFHEHGRPDGSQTSLRAIFQSYSYQHLRRVNVMADSNSKATESSSTTAEPKSKLTSVDWTSDDIGKNAGHWIYTAEKSNSSGTSTSSGTAPAFLCLRCKTPLRNDRGLVFHILPHGNHADHCQLLGLSGCMPAVTPVVELEWFSTSNEIRLRR
jgi:hypothetical protein